MNNFDRPKDITKDAGGAGNEGIAAAVTKDAPAFTSEYTSWTALTDLTQDTLFLRTYKGMNYTKFDLGALSKLGKTVSLPLATIDGLASDGTAALASGK